jgi:hypothetical protein
VGLFVVGCTAETHGTGPASLGAAGDVGGAGGAMTTGGATTTGGSTGGASMSGTGSGAGGASTVGGKVCGKIWYNGESGQGDVNLDAADSWTDPAKDPTKGTSMISESTTNPHGGTTSLEIDLNWATDYYGGAFGFNFAKYNKDRAFDVHAEADLEFWIRTESGNKTHVVVWLTDSNGKGSNRVDITSSALVTPQWRKVSIPLTQFSGVDLTSIWEVDADTHSDPFGVAGGVKFFVDDGAFTTPGCN